MVELVELLAKPDVTMLSAPLPSFIVVGRTLQLRYVNFNKTKSGRKKVNYFKISLEKEKPSVVRLKSSR